MNCVNCMSYINYMSYVNYIPKLYELCIEIICFRYNIFILKFFTLKFP